MATGSYATSGVRLARSTCVSGSLPTSSYFHPKSRPFQLDHVFADPATTKKVTSWRVDTDPVARAEPCSDHAMIRVDIDDR